MSTTETFHSVYPAGSTGYYDEALDWIERLRQGGILSAAGAVVRLQRVACEVAGALWRPHVQDRAREIATRAQAMCDEIAAAAGIRPEEAMLIWIDEGTPSYDPEEWCVEGCGRRRRARPSGPGRPPKRCEQCQAAIERERASTGMRQLRESQAQG